MYRNCFAYIEKRWYELGIPAETERIRVKHGGPTQKQINEWYATGDPRGPAIGNELFHLHAPAFHRILGELHWHKGFKDVGAGRKTNGHHWQGMAEDVVVLKPLDTSGNIISGPVRLIDAVFAMGGVDARIVWNTLDPNSERTWVEPQHPGTPAPDPTPAPAPTPDPVPVPEPPPLPPVVIPPPIDHETLTTLMKEFSDVYGVAPGWEKTFEGLAEVVAHWSYLLLVRGHTADEIAADYIHRKNNR